MGLGVRLLPPSIEDTATAAAIKFSSKFEKNRRDKRAAIKASSIFPESLRTVSSSRAELEAKRRKINAAAASKVLASQVKPSSWQTSRRF
jgi:coiled-coil domain-containing protein 130